MCRNLCSGIASPLTRALQTTSRSGFRLVARSLLCVCLLCLSIPPPTPPPPAPASTKTGPSARSTSSRSTTQRRETQLKATRLRDRHSRQRWVSSERSVKANPTFRKESTGLTEAFIRGPKGGRKALDKILTRRRLRLDSQDGRRRRRVENVNRCGCSALHGNGQRRYNFVERGRVQHVQCQHVLGALWRHRSRPLSFLGIKGESRVKQSSNLNGKESRKLTTFLSRVVSVRHFCHAQRSISDHRLADKVESTARGRRLCELLNRGEAQRDSATHRLDCAAALRSVELRPRSRQTLTPAGVSKSFDTKSAPGISKRCIQQCMN